MSTHTLPAGAFSDEDWERAYKMCKRPLTKSEIAEMLKDFAAWEAASDEALELVDEEFPPE